MPSPTSRTNRSSRSSALVFLALFATVVSAPAGATQCVQAVFFDLGNTLISQSLPSPWPLFPTAQTAIDALQAAGIEVGVITNVPTQVPPFSRADLEALLQQPEFLDEFDVVLLSSLTDPLVSKPTPGIYTQAHALLPAPLPPIGATAFVGETLSEIANLQVAPTLGARAAGMIGIHLSTGAPSPLADYTMSPADLTDILDIVTETCTVFLSDFEEGNFAEWTSCSGCS
jgi:phosphoglycolate phosphatase-like HAD superfamily hydrolase